MNNKGQMVAIGGLIMLAMALIVGVILLQGSAQNVGQVTNTVAVVNESLGVASNSTTVYLTNYRALNDVVVVNSTNGAVVPATNYTLTNNVINNGALAVSFLPVSAPTAGFTGYEWNISGTAEPLTYGDSGGRSMASLIVIMMALALVAVAVVYAIKNYQQ